MSDLRQRRQRAGLTLGALARRAGTSVASLSRAERGLQRLSLELAARVEVVLCNREAEAAEAAAVARLGRAALDALRGELAAMPKDAA